MGAITAKSVLMFGVASVMDFGYAEIRRFGRDLLAGLLKLAPEARTVGLTIHGPGYGLDEREAFEALIAGLRDGLESGESPHALEALMIIELDAGRATRLTTYLREILGASAVGVSAIATRGQSADSDRRTDVGIASESKPHVFVAMPFDGSNDDHFHYGIQSAVNNCGYLCERVDRTVFSGTIINRIKDRIDSASLLVADLSGQNENVYLEVGYAWGKGIPTVLLINDASELAFDVRGERCLVYGSIKDLETKLTEELAGLVKPRV